MTILHAVEFMVFTPLGGILGALAMSAFIVIMSRRVLHEPINMIEAIGSLVTGSLENSMRVGMALHLASGIFFSFNYTILFMAMHTGGLPETMFAGIGFGFFHGLIVSYALMFYVSDKHPIERYRRMSFQVGGLHLLGHMIYGGIVGLIVGIPPHLTS